MQALPRMRDLMATWQRKAKLVWLLGCTSNASDAELAAFAAYGDAVGPDKVPQSAFCPAGIDIQIRWFASRLLMWAQAAAC